VENVAAAQLRDGPRHPTSKPKPAAPAATPATASRPSADRGSRDVLKLNDPLFARASDFLRARTRSPEHPGAGLPRFLDLGGAAALVRLVHTLPALPVHLTASPTGVAIGEQLAGRSLGVPRIRLCAAVLDVPADFAERPSGKRHQALRTALTAAQAAGMTVHIANDDRDEIAAQVVRSAPWRAEWSQTVADRGNEEWIIALDRDRRLVGLAAILVDRQWASLITLIGLPDSPLQSHARYALHHAILRDLSRRGVRRLGVFEHSPLLLPPQTRHLQHIMGYRPVRLHPPTYAAL
jgi:hypothetical protein